MLRIKKWSYKLLDHRRRDQGLKRNAKRRPKVQREKARRERLTRKPQVSLALNHENA